MAYTNPYSEAAPLGSVAANLIDDLMRSQKLDFRERLESIFGVGIFNTDPVTIAQLKFTAATSKVLPGATSLSIRNNADSADNILISDAGVVTIRTSLISPLFTLTAASSKIIPGVTSLSLRNNADSADNVLISDAGIVTVRAGLVVSSGGINISGASAFIGGGQVTFSGSIAISGSTVIIDGASGVKRTLRYTTGGSLRWEAQTTNTAESGANAGSDYALSAYDDGGLFITNALQITRANRLATFGGDITITHGGGPSFLNLSNPAGQDRRIRFQTSGVDRFTIGIGSGLETGANAGSDVVFRVMDDAGATIADFLTVIRATGISTFSKQVIITNNSAPTLEIKKDASVDNRYIRLTDTEVSGQQWDLIQRSVASGSHFLIFNVTGNIIAVQVTPTGIVTIGAQVTGSPSFVVDRSVAAGNNGLIQINRSGVAKGFLGLDGGDNFTIFSSGAVALLTVGASISGAIFDAVTGFRIGGAAALGRFLRGDGTNFVSNTIQSGDLPTALTPTTIAIGGGTALARAIKATLTWNPGTVNTSPASVSTTLTVTGAQVGDAVMFANPWVQDQGSAQLEAFVSSLNTVTFTLTQTSGGASLFTNRSASVLVIG